MISFLIFSFLLMLTLAIPADSFVPSHWIIKWWQWVMSMPEGKDPVTNSSVLQQTQPDTDKKYFFLTGTYNGNATRNVTIPAGYKVIFFPVVDGAWSCLNLCIPFLTQIHLEEQAALKMDNVSSLVATLDGKNIPYTRMKTSLFDLHFVSGNIFDYKEGTYPTIGEGYWSFLPVPQSGNHILHIKGSIPGFYYSEATYNLKVLEN